jgi:hypothetical protein
VRLTGKPIEPVRKTREVPLSVERAFELFTVRIGTWWPVATHSLAGSEVTSVRFEGRIGGRVFEVASDGTEQIWAEVLAWDPPSRFVLSWHPNPDPVAASVVHVRFESADAGCTISIEHRGWEEFGDDEGMALRDRYDPGWDAVLAPFVGAATRTPS